MCVTVAVLACSSSSTLPALGDANEGGSGGTAQIPANQASSADECVFHGTGGLDLRFCDYVSVEFSTPLALPDVEVEVDTNTGDHLTSSQQVGDLGPTVALFESGSNALGFAIRKAAQFPHYSPDWIDVVVHHNGKVVADTKLTPTYSCVKITSDDWCWKSKSEKLEVTP